ncbi:recombinase family protein [Salinivibrio sp. VYel6]|uniref:recombinase family protein n=1 Tax=Salinivibrio sp. VYel6 TaxID=2490493 RepID=UPI00128D6159|nr:recombinase family protein [Salinivibrio sp. VYel6]MPX97880.1 recombinase family protein [Salinivibrio sp. VYel6]
MAVIAYYRVSTDDQTIENQRRELNKTYRIDKEFADCGVSGTVSAEKRPEFKKLLDYVREGDTLVTVDLDRLGRDSIDVQNTVRELLRGGVNVIVTRLGVDLSTDAGELLVTILSKVAEMERRKMLERANAGRERAKAEGKHMGRPHTISKEQVHELRSKGYSINATAEALGCSVSSVKRLQRRL